MDVKLLEKIEELTLYSIEQNKRIQKLEDENLILRKKSDEIQDLKSKVETLISNQK